MNEATDIHKYMHTFNRIKLIDLQDMDNIYCLSLYCAYKYIQIGTTSFVNS